jgi:hypothetical protein
MIIAVSDGDQRWGRLAMATGDEALIILGKTWVNYESKMGLGHYT